MARVDKEAFEKYGPSAMVPMPLHGIGSAGNEASRSTASDPIQRLIDPAERSIANALVPLHPAINHLPSPPYYPKFTSDLKVHPIAAFLTLLDPIKLFIYDVINMAAVLSGKSTRKVGKQTLNVQAPDFMRTPAILPGTNIDARSPIGDQISRIKAVLILMILGFQDPLILGKSIVKVAALYLGRGLMTIKQEKDFALALAIRAMKSEQKSRFIDGILSELKSTKPDLKPFQDAKKAAEDAARAAAKAAEDAAHKAGETIESVAHTAWNALRVVNAPAVGTPPPLPGTKYRKNDKWYPPEPSFAGIGSVDLLPKRSLIPPPHDKPVRLPNHAPEAAHAINTAAAKAKDAHAKAKAAHDDAKHAHAAIVAAHKIKPSPASLKRAEEHLKQTASAVATTAKVAKEVEHAAHQAAMKGTSVATAKKVIAATEHAKKVADHADRHALEIRDLHAKTAERIPVKPPVAARAIHTAKHEAKTAHVRALKAHAKALDAKAKVIGTSVMRPSPKAVAAASARAEKTAAAVATTKQAVNAIEKHASIAAVKPFAVSDRHAKDSIVLARAATAAAKRADDHADEAHAVHVDVARKHPHALHELDAWLRDGCQPILGIGALGDGGATAGATAGGAATVNAVGGTGEAAVAAGTAAEATAPATTPDLAKLFNTILDYVTKHPELLDQGLKISEQVIDEGIKVFTDTKEKAPKPGKKKEEKKHHEDKKGGMGVAPVLLGGAALVALPVFGPLAAGALAAGAVAVAVGGDKKDDKHP